MIRLPSASNDVVWIDLFPGVRVRVRPHTVAAIIVARADAGKVFRADEANADPQTGAKATSAMVRSLARFAIIEWEGVGGEDDLPAEVTLDGIDALMSVWPAYDGFERLYVGPALSGEAEKNG
ncbi:hypothetical protein G3T14_23315 [Methylobacterium sp. BTF04]|uniref:hypothetical protein n=1 Tax=Methylobacterium sp. BTF04 TaxID=2708300 RepID=UPI0013D27F8B|nr:hypothetical protein [Methylobacterium sp. BTF04]NEU14977.1 hypothetical protein [Methylobacterium sp. BTF04]